ncbi:MAG: glycosyl hydrolase family 5 [bacterium]|nr:glycosyl hydrolase family 5 [bacterium]
MANRNERERHTGRSPIRWVVLVAVAGSLAVWLAKSNMTAETSPHVTAPPQADAETTTGTQDDQPSPSSNPAAPQPDMPPVPAADMTGPMLGFEMTIEADATVRLRHDHAPIVSALPLFWAANWQWVGSEFAIGYGPSDEWPIKGGIPGLGTEISGYASHDAANTYTFHYVFDVEKPLTDIIGGGLEWNLNLAPASLAAAPATPELLPGNLGWRWVLAPGQIFEVRFSEPAPEVYFEQGDTSRIRTKFLGETVPAGRHYLSMTLSFPAGTKRIASAAERYGPVRVGEWHADAMIWNQSPVDLRFLNDAPAGEHGFIRAQGDALAFEDGTPARFWGGNLAAYALFQDDKAIAEQARRIAQLGYNLMRIHHHDSMEWVHPNVIDLERDDSRHFNDAALDRIDFWVKCLKEEGVYVWLDLHVGRMLKAGDGATEFGRIPGFEEIYDGERRGGDIKGFNYYNPVVQDLMKEFNAKYLDRVNPYTKTAYPDEPAIVGLLITNENDLTGHFGNRMLPDKDNPKHNRMFMKALESFCKRTGLDAGEAWKTWVPGPSKIFLNEQEHQFNTVMLDALRDLGVRVPVATTNTWGTMGLQSLPSLTEGGIIDVHSYGGAEALSANPRYTSNFVTWIGAAQVHGKPLAVTEWNVPYDHVDRFTAPLYVSAVACLQGWDAPMVYNYSQAGLGKPERAEQWSSFYDPGLTAIMPAAALAFRQQHVRPAAKTVCLNLTPKQLFWENLDPRNSVALRTLVEQNRLTIGLPDVSELDWDRPSSLDASVEVLTDPHRDCIPKGQNHVVSDTGELKRDWAVGMHTVDTPKTQAASGWIGGRDIQLADVRMAVRTPKAVVAVTSMDGAPIRESRRILATVVARVVAVDGRMPFLSEPVEGRFAVRAPEGLTLRALGPSGTPGDPLATAYQDGAYIFDLTPQSGTHWFMLE